MYCENCGREIADHSPACNYCGHVQGPAQGGAAMPPPAAPPSYSKPYRPRAGGPFLVLWPYRFVLQALESGSIIRIGVTLALRILGGLTVLAGIYSVIELLKAAFNLPTADTITGIVVAALIGLAFFSAFQVLFYRAASVSELGSSSFTVMEIASILLRTIGEVYAISAGVLGVAGCISAWFAGGRGVNLGGTFIPALPIPMENLFLFGLAILVFLNLIGFGVLILFYFLAETVVVMADIAINIRSLVKANGAPGS